MEKYYVDFIRPDDIQDASLEYNSLEEASAKFYRMVRACNANFIFGAQVILRRNNNPIITETII